MKNISMDTQFQMKEVEYLYDCNIRTNKDFAFKHKLITKLNNGELVVAIRHYWFEHDHTIKKDFKGLFYYKESDDTILFKHRIDNPVLKWDKQPFLDYERAFVGNLSYVEFCKLVDEDNMYIFHDFTRCSERMWNMLKP